MPDKNQIEEALWDLQRTLTKYFSDLLTHTPESIKGSTLDCIRAFLKDNSITRNELNRTRAMCFDGLDEILEEWGNEIDPDSQDDSSDPDYQNEWSQFKLVN